MKILRNKMVLMVLGLLLGAGVALGVTVAFGETLGITAKSGPPQIKYIEKPKFGIMLPLPERIVNLADPGVMRYLKVSVVLEMSDLTLKEQPKGEEYKKKQDELKISMASSTPLIADEMTSLLTSKSSMDLMSPDGKQKLRDELKSRINKAFERVAENPKDRQEVLSVYFSDFIIQ